MKIAYASMMMIGAIGAAQAQEKSPTDYMDTIDTSHKIERGQPFVPVPDANYAVFSIVSDITPDALEKIRKACKEH